MAEIVSVNRIKKLIYVYKKLWSKFYLYILKKCWRSKRGVALLNAVWYKYKNSPMFKERAEYFGREGAAQMLSYVEFKLLQHLLTRDSEFMFILIFKPSILLKKYVNEDRYLKKFINLNGQRG